MLNAFRFSAAASIGYAAITIFEILSLRTNVHWIMDWIIHILWTEKGESIRRLSFRKSCM